MKKKKKARMKREERGEARRDETIAIPEEQYCTKERERERETLDEKRESS